MCNSCAGINLLIKINKTSPASVAARQGGFIDPVRCVQTSLVKPAPTQSKTLALPLLKDMILLIIKALFLQWVRNPVF